MVHRSSLLGNALALAAAVAFAGCARAAVIPVSQTRSISTFASISQADGQPPAFESQEEESGDSGLFDTSVESHVEAGGSFATGFAAQTSLIEAELIQAEGSFWAMAGLEEPTPFAEGMGFTKLTQRFEVDGPTPFSLIGVLAAADNGQASVQLLKINSGVLIYTTASDNEVPILEESVLEAGLYEFSVWSFGFGQAIAPDENNSASGSFTMTLSFSDPASVPPTLPAELSLRIQPNPLRDAAIIAWDGIAEPGARVMIVDAAGRQVRSLGSGVRGRATWDIRDDRGVRVGPGVYFVRVGRWGVGKATVLP